MHLELPKAQLKSFGDFLKHYLMIVLSILTALGLEAGLDAWSACFKSSAPRRVAV